MCILRKGVLSVMPHTSTGKLIVCNNNSHIPERILQRMIRILEGNTEAIIQQWIEHFGEINYFC